MAGNSKNNEFQILFQMDIYPIIKILDKRSINKQIHYSVLWESKDISWVPEFDLLDKEMIENFERKLKTSTKGALFGLVDKISELEKKVKYSYCSKLNC